MLTESDKVFIKYINEIKAINSYTEFLRWQVNDKLSKEGINYGQRFKY